MSDETHKWTARVAVILVRPQSGENIGLAARAMANTGFCELRIVGLDSLPDRAEKTGVHAIHILNAARFYPNLAEATADLHMLFAGTSKRRKKFSLISLDEAVETMVHSPSGARLGLIFGNERTGLISTELQHSNFLFTIPQSGIQPSYNLAAAVLLTLFSLFEKTPLPAKEGAPDLLTREEQEACIKLILQKIHERGFIKPQSREHITQIVFDLFGRIRLTDRDRGLLLALFSKGLE